MSPGGSGTLADVMAGALRLFREPFKALEVRVEGAPAGRIFSIGRRRVVVCDDRCGSIEVRHDERVALESLHGGRRFTLSRDLVEVLAMAAVPRDATPRDLAVLAGHCFRSSGTGWSCHAAVGLGDAVDLHASEVDAVASMLPEVLWRAGWTEGEVPGLDGPASRRLRDALPGMLRVA